MGTKFTSMKSLESDATTGSTGGNAGLPKPDEKKTKGQKAMSKRLSGAISQCSSKMTEVLSWQSKLQDNKVGMILDLH